MHLCFRLLADDFVSTEKMFFPFFLPLSLSCFDQPSSCPYRAVSRVHDNASVDAFMDVTPRRFIPFGRYFLLTGPHGLIAPARRATFGSDKSPFFFGSLSSAHPPVHSPPPYSRQPFVDITLQCRIGLFFLFARMIFARIIPCLARPADTFHLFAVRKVSTPAFLLPPLSLLLSVLGSRGGSHGWFSSCGA